MKILNAAFEEFSDYGYKLASTNRIVKKAGTGKGMLYYYFNSKKGLFEYLVDYAIKFVVNEYLSKIDENESNFIDKFKFESEIKMSAYKKNPYVFNFLGTLYLNKEVELPIDLEKRLLEVNTLGYTKIYKNIDTSLFREDINPDKMLKYIRYSIDGYEKELMNHLKTQKLSSIDVETLLVEFNIYLADLKIIYYK